MNSPHILIADDHAHIRRLVQQCLQRGGFESFHFATTGGEMLQLARECGADLVILDFDMPEMDGLTALRELRADACLRHIPVIMMSGFGRFHACMDACALGADEVLPKPFAPSALLESVGRILGAAV